MKGGAQLWPWLALVVLCSSLFMCTAPGRITYPDDEIVFRTTQSLVERGDLAVEPIANRTGERPDRPTGSFGWAEGRGGQRYGIFGQGLSLVAIPAYVLAKRSAPAIPPLWTRAVRSDLFVFHPRGPEADWLRMVVSSSNCLLTALGALLLGLWLRELGHGPRVSMACALIYALGTTAWVYAGTFLSEPLSVIVLLGAALEISRWHRARAQARHLWIAAALAGASVHVHLLNLIALPCLLGYALAPSWRDLLAGRERRTWLIALGIGALGLAALGLSQWWRFGDPLESGRYDDYGRWVWPFEGALTMLVAPGRSVLLYSPPLCLALVGWGALRRRDPNTAYLVLALAVSRWLFVACRSDWHGGWGVGPRYLVPIVPFLMVPLAELLARWSSWSLGRRMGVGLFLVGSALLQAWLALHSIFQVMWNINHAWGRERYWEIADWRWWAAPPIQYWRLQRPALARLLDGDLAGARALGQFDALIFGSWRLASMSEADGLWWLMLANCGLGLTAGLALGWWWWAQAKAPSRPRAEISAS
ncbi:hypothetical protein G6O69_13670 [Pseudenhygromyxa sp. WMMC2535]|uniref:hypothetical protein n=1 Tax=Pseudenhygromyxa sp. WMMC2535 TaxID=2712867 RepID=UPI001558231C|nr:hypothetical protein [Pseudenhygromyxa sp. WMMC2535]NVB38885.1 hypothetical protein [Pseudenhygromyxa sp. WMMC2535]